MYMYVPLRTTHQYNCKRMCVCTCTYTCSHWIDLCSCLLPGLDASEGEDAEEGQGQLHGDEALVELEGKLVSDLLTGVLGGREHSERRERGRGRRGEGATKRERPHLHDEGQPIELPRGDEVVVMAALG